MISKSERFWISFILRLAFGFFFLFAAINIFNAGGPSDGGPQFFARSLSKPFADTWMGDIPPVVASYTATNADGQVEQSASKLYWSRDVPGTIEVAGRELKKASESHWTFYFLLGLPFVVAAISVPILTGLFLRPALRLGAVLLVLLGLGKYVTSSTDLTTTANDFFFAFLICAGLYFLGQEKREEEQEEVAL
jgi:hypothetical protein